MDDKTRPDKPDTASSASRCRARRTSGSSPARAASPTISALRRPGLCGDGALAASACAHRRHRRGAGEGDAGRARRVHRRRLRRRQAQAHSARSGAEDQIRHEAARAGRRRGVHRPAYAAARRQGAPCRRGGRHGGGRDQGAGDGCRRSGRGAATRNCRSCCIPKTRCGPARRRSGTKCRTTSSVDTQFGDAAGDRRGVRARRACRDARNSMSAASPACRWSRAPRSAHYDAATGRYTLYAGSGGAVRQKSELVDRARRSRPRRCACFRTTSAAISAPATASSSNSAWCCGRRRKLGRPVKFTATRSEAFLSDYQGRDLVTKVELALDDKRPVPRHARRPISAMSARAACRCRR